jgi:hypothetical protein
MSDLRNAKLSNLRERPKGQTHSKDDTPALNTEKSGRFRAPKMSRWLREG